MPAQYIVLTDDGERIDAYATQEIEAKLKEERRDYSVYKLSRRKKWLRREGDGLVKA